MCTPNLSQPPPPQFMNPQSLHSLRSSPETGIRMSTWMWEEILGGPCGRGRVGGEGGHGRCTMSAMPAPPAAGAVDALRTLFLSFIPGFDAAWLCNQSILQPLRSQSHCFFFASSKTSDNCLCFYPLPRSPLPTVLSFLGGAGIRGQGSGSGSESAPLCVEP